MRNEAIIASVHALINATSVSVVWRGQIMKVGIVASFGVVPVVGDIVVLERLPASGELYISGTL